MIEQLIHLPFGDASYNQSLGRLAKVEKAGIHFA